MPTARINGSNILTLLNRWMVWTIQLVGGRARLIWSLILWFTATWLCFAHSSETILRVWVQIQGVVDGSCARLVMVSAMISATGLWQWDVRSTASWQTCCPRARDRPATFLVHELARCSRERFVQA